MFNELYVAHNKLNIFSYSMYFYINMVYIIIFKPMLKIRYVKSNVKVVPKIIYNVMDYITNYSFDHVISNGLQFWSCDQ